MVDFVDSPRLIRRGSTSILPHCEPGPPWVRGSGFEAKITFLYYKVKVHPLSEVPLCLANCRRQLITEASVG